MNKQLLSFTALVAVGLLGASGAAVAQKKMKASKPTISVGGYMDQGVRFTDNADAIGGRDTGGFAAWQDSEIHFKIAGQLDNGIKIGGGWELEGTSEDSFIDEARVWLRGGFGELRLGQDDGAGNGVTYAEYKLTVDMKDGSTFNPDQVQVTRWREGKAYHIKFYYDPSKL